MSDQSLYVLGLVALQSYVVSAGPPSVCPQYGGCPSTESLDIILNEDAYEVLLTLRTVEYGEDDEEVPILNQDQMVCWRCRQVHFDTARQQGWTGRRTGQSR
jgi:hypothetical protein